MRARLGHCRPEMLQLLIWIVASMAAHAYVIIDGGAVVTTEDDFKAALLDSEVRTVYIYDTIKLSPGPWFANAVNINRTLTVTAHSTVQTPLLDITDVAQGAVVCASPLCILTFQGITIRNSLFPSGFDFQTPIPNMFSVMSDGKLNLQQLDVISLAFGGLWNASNVVLQPSSARWAGNISIACQSPTEIVFKSWVSYGRDRGQFLNVVGWQNFTNYVNLTNVRLLLSQSYVCSSSYTAAQCNSVLQTCNSSLANTPLPASSCSPDGLRASCRPAPPFYTQFPGYPSITAPPPLSPASTLGSSSDSPSLWWVGLVVGLVVGIGLLAAGIGYWVVHRRKQRSLPSSSSPSPPSALVGVTKGTDISMGELKIVPEHKSHGPDSAGRASTTSTDPVIMMVQPGAHPSSGSLGSRQHHVIELAGENPDGKAGYNSFWQATGNPQDVNATGFTCQSPGGTLREDTNGALLGASRAVVIDMAPPASSDGGVQQLTRNPLGVTLHALLGSGAYGTVYSGTWKEQQVAVKVIRQQVSDEDDLEAILDFKEATLGTELHHPRIVRTLAHALVLPDGLLDESGRFQRPGAVEAHIVSSLCDRGTLKAWLQTTRSPFSNVSTSATTQAAIFSAQHTAAGKAANLLSQPLRASVTTVTGPAAPDMFGRASAPQDMQAGQLIGAVAAGGLDFKQQLASHPRSMDADALPVAPTTGSAGAGTPVSGLSGRQGSLVAGDANSACATLYPPLTCMASAGELGPVLHADFTCHMVAIIDILLEVADGLSYLLSKGVVHGDLKPQNCLCCSDPNALRGFSIQICDFGISRVIHGSKSHTTVSTPPGTLAYFAPELLSTCHLSPACDLYSFGIIMYELVTCRQPLGNLTMAQVLYKKATGKVDEYLVFPPDTPEAYVALAKACYSVEAACRPSLPDVQSRLLVVREQLVAAWHLPQPPPPAPLPRLQSGSFVSQRAPSSTASLTPMSASSS